MRRKNKFRSRRKLPQIQDSETASQILALAQKLSEEDLSTLIRYDLQALKSEKNAEAICEEFKTFLRKAPLIELTPEEYSTLLHH